MTVEQFLLQNNIATQVELDSIENGTSHYSDVHELMLDRVNYTSIEQMLVWGDEAELNKYDLTGIDINVQALGIHKNIKAMNDIVEKIDILRDRMEQDKLYFTNLTDYILNNIVKEVNTMRAEYESRIGHRLLTLEK